MTELLAIAGSAALIALVLRLVLGRPRSTLEQLVVEYRKRTGLPAHLAADSLDAQVERLRKRTPGKTLEWYVRRALQELEKDR